MRIAFLTKYPPIQGGTCAQNYWLIRGLARRGHEIHVITNAWEVEDRYRTRIEPEDLPDFQPPNVRVHSTNPFLNPRFIPFTNPYEAKLSSLAIEVVREYRCDLIDSSYLLPYVLAGHTCKVFTGRPQLMRHASSDINHLWHQPPYRTIFTEVLRTADGLFTQRHSAPRFEKIGLPPQRIFPARHGIDRDFFHPGVQPFDLRRVWTDLDPGFPVLTYFGKISPSQGTFRLLEAASRLREEFVLLFVVEQGRSLEILLKRASELGLKEKVRTLRCVPPWRVPGLLAASSLVVKPEYDFPLPHMPVIPREAMAVARPVLITTDLAQKLLYAKIIDGESGFVCEPRELSDFSGKLRQVLQSSPEELRRVGENGLKLLEEVEGSDQAVQSTLEAYQQVLERGGHVQ